MGSLIKEYRVFPTGDTFKATETINNIADGTSVTVNDPGPFYEAPPANSGLDYCVYTRLFWNAAGAIGSAASVNVTVKGSTTVTCWYQHGCSPGGGGTTITTYAFDVDANAVMAGVTPIGSVTPGGLWNSPSTTVTVSNSATIAIDAKDSIGAEPFTKWMVFGSGSPSGDDVVIPPGGGGFYIAFYQVPKPGGFTFDWSDLLDWMEKVPDFDFDEVVDPSPLDKLRLALLAAKLSKAGTPIAGAKGVASTRQELTRVRAELKRLAAREKSLTSQVELIGGPGT